MTISTQVTQMQPAFEDGKMVLGNVTVVVNFQEPQNYFGGQVVLTSTDDGISFTTTQDELRDLAIAKAKILIANSKAYEIETKLENISMTEETTTADSTSDTTSRAADSGTGENVAENISTTDSGTGEMAVL